MGVKATLATWLAKHRVAQLQGISKNAMAAQQRTFAALLGRGKKTDFGRDHHFGGIRSVADYQATVPIRRYEDFEPYISRAYAGQPNVLWPGLPAYFAETSGTTAGAKRIPLTKEMMRKQVQGAKDALLCYISQTGNADFLDGKMIFLSGSPELHTNPAGIPVGRLSGISQHFVPGYLQRNRVPSFETNCIAEWETKLQRILDETISQDLRLVSGIPPWVQMFFERLNERTGKKPCEVWPNLRVYAHGGVDYRPYRDIFFNALGQKVDMVETYPASEGFIAIQDDPEDDGLLLLLDSGLFYEFVPLQYVGQPSPPRLTVAELEVGQHYAIVLTTNAGLWAYEIGDTVRVTSIHPLKIRVSGRVKHFISAFGEHVIQEEVNNAMLAAVAATAAQVSEFTVAPLVSPHAGQSCHEWLVEFVVPPPDMRAFRQALDDSMQAQNPYYRNLRAGNMLAFPPVRVLQLHASREYMQLQGKLGGQNKFPRLANDRKVADALAPFITEGHG